ncbi:hypothetical protein BX265_5685 [Streptomyces sp. TLI_235]|nr:hypothetical protein [Streptomyces sp. TLI_235]PBC71105.1 hypothetical protein BX265_5685 [Streptomyces sp. TLI_235]
MRALIGSWLAAEEVPEPSGVGPCADEDCGGALPVPPATGAEVAEAARRLALREFDGSPSAAAPPVLSALAEALVVDEHPSAAHWTAPERADAVRWVALLVHRFGEDGVQELVAELSR